MPKLPRPDVEVIASVEPAYETCGGVLWRVQTVLGDYALAWDELRRFGPFPSARFDPWTPPMAVRESGVGYFGFDIATCLAEVFQETRMVNTRAVGYQLTAFTVTRTLRLLDVRGDYPIRVGASHSLNGGAKDRCREWAAAFVTAFPDLDGLLYSGMAGRDCAVLYDPARDAFGDGPDFSRALEDPAIAERIANAVQEIGYQHLA